MAIFPLTGYVTKTVTEIISLDVEADSYDEAQSKAEKVLATYPKAHDLPGVPFCWLESRHQDAVLGMSITERIEEDSA